MIFFCLVSIAQLYKYDMIPKSLQVTKNLKPDSLAHSLKNKKPKTAPNPRRMKPIHFF